LRTDRVAFFEEKRPEPEGPNQPPTLGKALPRLADLFDSQTPQPLFKGSKVSALEELALTETQFLEQTAALLGVSLAQLVKTGALVYAKREFLNRQSTTACLADPKKIIRALAQLRDLVSADAVNTTTSPQLPKYVSAAFGSLDKPWKPGHLRSAYAAICCHRFKPQNQTDDIFLAQILGHKLLGPNASLSVGQSYKDFYIRKP
jgi:Telomere resolvase ResT/TelK catalytic domain